MENPIFRKLALLGTIALLTSCAVDKKSILLDVEPATPLDQRDLQKHCDLGDAAACTLGDNDGTSLPSSFPILQGVAPGDSAVFSALVPKSAQPAWFLYERDLGRLWKIASVRTISRPKATHAVQIVQVRNLLPHRSYELLAADPEGHLLEDRVFRPLSEEKGKSRIALVSGLKGRSIPSTEKLFASLWRERPQLLFFSGGNVEAALPSGKKQPKASEVLDHFFERHLRARSTLPAAFASELTPAAALWDESEFGATPASRAFPFRDQAREAFEAFFPRLADEKSVVDGPGLALSFRLGGQELALLDDLTFRKPSPPLPALCAKKPHAPQCKTGLSSPQRLGAIQSDWLLRRARKSDRPLWLVTSEPRFGGQRPRAEATLNPAWAEEAEKRLFSPLDEKSSFHAFALLDTEWDGSVPRTRLATFGEGGEAMDSRLLAPLEIPPPSRAEE